MINVDNEYIMLGLAFIGGEAPEPDLCQLLARRADLIVAADSGLQTAENAGLRPDWVIGDMDSLDDLGRLEKYPADKVLRFRQDKDHTDTELALDLLREQGCEKICIIGGGGGRLDHILALRSLFERKKYPERWVTKNEDIYCLDVLNTSGGVLNIKVPLSSLVSVFPLGSGPWDIESNGLKWPLNGLSWEMGSIGISNTTVEDQFGIRVNKGRFLLIVPLI